MQLKPSRSCSAGHAANVGSAAAYQDLNWLNNNKESNNASLACKSSMRRSSLSQLHELLLTDENASYSGRNRSTTGGRSSVLCNAQLSSIRSSRSLSCSQLASLPDTEPTLYSSSFGNSYVDARDKHTPAGSAASQPDQGSHVQSLSMHLASLSHQLHDSRQTVARLSVDKDILQQRVSAASGSRAEAESAVAALLKNNEQLQKQLQQVMEPKQQSGAVPTAAAFGAAAFDDDAAPVQHLSATERKLVKLLKKMHKDKDRCAGQSEYLLVLLLCCYGFSATGHSYCITASLSKTVMSEWPHS